MVEEELRNQFARLYAPATTGQGAAERLPQILADWHEWMSLLGDIVKVPSPKHLRLSLSQNKPAMAAALLNPGQDSPGWLADSVPRDLLLRIKRLRGIHQALIECLIEVVADEPRPEPEDLGEAKALPHLSEFVVPGEAKLDVDAVRDSAYFFA